jgi:hypothetical protein
MNEQTPPPSGQPPAPPPSGQPTPPPTAPGPAAGTPPPPPPPVAGDEKASGGMRAGAVLLALVLAFGCAVMAAVMVDIGDSPTCEDVLSGEATIDLSDPDADCFEESQAQKTASLVLGWPSAVLAGIGALMLLAFAVRGRGGSLALKVAGAAIVLGILSIVVGSV